MAGSVSADAVVLGAGFVGLAAARRLAKLRPSWHIVTLEAQRAGHGASGRSSGFVVDLAGFIAAMEPTVAERYIRLSRDGIARLKALVDRHAIDAEWDDRGWFHVAAGDEGLHGLESLERWLAQRQESFEALDGAALSTIVGSDFYRAGLRLPGSVLVHAGKLVRGLADCLPETVTLYERSPVTAIHGESSFELETPAGTVTTPRLIVALNGYSANLGFLRRRVFPLLTFGSLTRPLTEIEQSELGGEREWGLLAQDPMGSSVRRTRDQRLLIRNTVAYRRDARVGQRRIEAARNTHRRSLAARFPALGSIELPYTWSGAMGVSPSLRPFFGEIVPQLYAAAGFTGAGIAMGTTAGELLADWAAGEDSTRLEDMRSIPQPRWIPPEPFLSPGIRWRVERMNRQAGPTP